MSDSYHHTLRPLGTITTQREIEVPAGYSSQTIAHHILRTLGTVTTPRETEFPSFIAVRQLPVVL